MCKHGTVRKYLSFELFLSANSNIFYPFGHCKIIIMKIGVTLNCNLPYENKTSKARVPLKYCYIKKNSLLNSP